MTGRPAFDRVFGLQFFEYLKTHPADNALFDATMSSGTTQALSVFVAAYDFSQFNRIVDVGGGQGALLAAILSANPGLHGALFDQPAVVEGASATLKAFGELL